MGVLKSLLGKDAQLDQLPAELRPLVEQMRHERTAYETLVKRAQQVANAEQIAQLEQRLAGLDKLAAQIGDFRQGAAKLEESHRATRESLAETRSLADSIRTDLEAMRSMLAEVQAAKAELRGVLELAKSAAALRTESGAMEARIREGAATLANVQAGVARIESLAARAEGLETAVEQLQQLIKGVPDAKRELSTLNVLAEYVSRKVATLETQRDLVDRVTQRTERLAELTGQVDRQLQEQHQNSKFLEQLETSVNEVKKLHVAASEQAQAIEQKYQAMDVEGKKLAEAFVVQRDALQQSAAMFKFEHDGIEAVNQRVTEVRKAVTGVEQRLPALDATRTGIEAAASDLKQLTGAVQDTAGRLAELEATTPAVQAAMSKVRDLQAAVDELARRMEALAPKRLANELEERAALVEETRARVARLEQKTTDWDALEQRIDQSLEIARERRAAVEVFQADLQRLFGVADSAVKRVRAAVELEQQVDLHHQALDPVLEKLRQLDEGGQRLDEYSKKFGEAEERLSRLDAVLMDLQSTFQAVLGQKEFLERVVETAGNLAMQTMEAEGIINTLRQAEEGAKSRRPTS